MRIAQDYTVDEIMVVAMAREIRDGDIVFQGITTPLAGAAIMLARETHARNASHLYFLGVNPVIHDISEVMVKPENFLGKVYGLLSIHEFWNLQQRGGVSLMFFRPAQIDRFGNANMTLVGDRVRPAIRFSGVWAQPTSWFWRIGWSTTLPTTRRGFSWKGWTTLPGRDTWKAGSGGRD